MYSTVLQVTRYNLFLHIFNHAVYSGPCWLFFLSTLIITIIWWKTFISVQFSSVAQSRPTLCDPMNPSTPGLPVHHQLPEFTQTHVHWVADAIQPSRPLLSPSPPAPNPSQHQGFFQWKYRFRMVKGGPRKLDVRLISHKYHKGDTIYLVKLLGFGKLYLGKRNSSLVNFKGWQNSDMKDDGSLSSTKKMNDSNVFKCSPCSFFLNWKFDSKIKPCGKAFIDVRKKMLVKYGII